MSEPPVSSNDRDIARAEKAEPMALSSEAEWRRALMEISRDGIAVFDPEQGIIEVNSRLAEMHGHAPEDMIGLHPWDFNAEMSEGEIRAAFPDLTTINTTIETRHRRKDGTLYDAEVSIRGACIGGRSICVSIERDISERKAQQRILEEREALLATIFNQVGVGIDLLDVETQRFVQFNRTSRDLLGYSAEEFAQVRLSDILALSAEDFERLFRETLAELRSRETLSLELKHRRRDGCIIDGLVNLRLTHLRGREHILAVWSDVSRQKAIEMELARRDAILTAVANLSLLFLRSSQWTEVMSDALAELGSAARVSRAYMFEGIVGVDAPARCSQRFEWCAEGVEPQIANPRDQDFDWQAHGLSDWYETLCGGQPVIARRAHYSAAERRLLEPQGIQSVLMVPLFAGGDLLGFLGFDDCDKERNWSLAEVAALRSAAGVIGAAVERAGIQRQLVERERRYALATEAGKVGVWEWDPHTGQIFTDSVVHETLGQATEETITSIDRWFERLHPDDLATAEAIRRGIELQVLSGLDEVLRFVSNSGDMRSLGVRGKLIRNSQGIPVKVFGTAIDLTEQRRMEEDLRRASEEWSKTFDTVPDAIVMMDAKGRLIRTNRAYAKLVGPWSEALLNELQLRAYEADHSCLPDDRVHVTEIDEGAMDRLFRITTSILSDDQGGLRGSVHVIHDISDRHQAEQARLAHLEKQRDVLIREVHHRIKNHLQGLVGLLSQSLGPQGGGERVDKAIAQVQSIATVYGLQSCEAGSDVCFKVMLEAIVHNTQAFGSLPVSLSIDSSRWMDCAIVRDKAVALALVINELIQNALKWSAPISENASVQLACRQESDAVRLTLINRGSLPKGFDFEAGRGLGTGLGLLRDMLPRQGVTLTIGQERDSVVATLIMRPPVLVPVIRA